MRLLFALRGFGNPGGSETFTLTLADAIRQLGHDVHVRAASLGMVAIEARLRGIEVAGVAEPFPEMVDGTICLDQSMAIEMAARYPAAVRLYAMHNYQQPWLPPPEHGIVHATLAPNARFATLAKGCAGAGQVIRIRQPVDVTRFSPRGPAAARPGRVLYLGNNADIVGDRLALLQQAWSGEDLSWKRLGGAAPTLDVPSEMADADIVVGYGRAILEAMACGRPAYVHEHSGSDGFVTAANYESLEADGFAGLALRAHPSLGVMRADLAAYDAALGRVGQDLVRAHHDARLIAADIVACIVALGPPETRFDPHALAGLKSLSQSLMRAQNEADYYRLKLRQTAGFAKAMHYAARRWSRTVRKARRLRNRFGIGGN